MFKFLLNFIVNNSFIPVRVSLINNTHIALFCLVFIVLILQILFVPISTPVSHLYLTAFDKAESIGFDVDSLGEDQFSARGNNLWENLVYYSKYSQQLRKYFNINDLDMPAPRFPLVSVLFSLFSGGVHFLPPANIVDIASFIRSKMGSGITIRSKANLVGDYDLDAIGFNEVSSFFSNLKKALENRFEIRLTYLNSFNKVLTKNYRISYGNFPNFNRILTKIITNDVKFLSASLYKNFKAEFILHDSKDSFDDVLVESYKFASNDLDNIFTVFKRFKEHMANIYTFNVSLNIDGEDVSKKFLVRFDNYPRIYFILSKLNRPGIEFKKISVYESKVLKYKPNSRQWIDFSDIPAVVRKAFILLEDDYFYFQAGGIDPFGLINAAFRYVFYGENKGNASIIEQIYEMYLGKQNKSPWDKIVQVFGAIYLSAYETDRDRFANLYVQSIPGSFFRDHNYGVKGIIKSYLNKDSIKNITLRELAWLSRIALLPNTFGIDYVRFYIINQRFKQYGVDIFDKRAVRDFLENDNRSRIIFNNIYLKFSNNDDIFRFLQKLYRSYIVTNRYISIALGQFVFGNEFMKPIITGEEYSLAIGGSINFYPSRVVNIYQSYTDQTRKDMLRFIGVWSMNAGLDVEVAFNEDLQKIVDEELESSTSNMYNYIREESILGEVDKKRYGGAGVLVKTHDIKDNSILNYIIAISSKHTGNSFFNWAVDGNRQFGSILKWIAMMLYLDSSGTLLDSFYDIPRVFKYKKIDDDGKLKTFDYRPDNWRRRYDPYGFYTFDLRDNIYNFTQSKNNTFVYISEIIGLERFSNFLNEASEIKLIEDEKIRKRLSFKPILPLVLGAHETTSIKMAQITSIIANKGVFQPLTTIIRIIDINGESLYLDLSLDRKQIISREAAEAAFFCGYLNSYFGTAKRFIKGGVGKTGSSNMDVGFLAMSARTKNEYLDYDPAHVLNSNLLYLVNMGLDRGKVHTGLFGGTAGAINAKNVFDRILTESFDGKIFRHPISGDFTNFFSKEFEYFDYDRYPSIDGKKIMVPVLRNRNILREDKISLDDISLIKADYVRYRDSIRLTKLARQIALDNGFNYDRISDFERQRFLSEAFSQIQVLDFMRTDDYLSDYDVGEFAMNFKDKPSSQDDSILEGGESYSRIEDLASKKKNTDDYGFDGFSAISEDENSLSDKDSQDILNQIFKAEKGQLRKKGGFYDYGGRIGDNFSGSSDGFAPVGDR